ncbi:MAG: hypothetical protein V3U19_03685 [Thermodesulfobacteriota bacterium]
MIKTREQVIDLFAAIAAKIPPNSSVSCRGESTVDGAGNLLKGVLYIDSNTENDSGLEDIFDTALKVIRAG